jgi:hypothetical protein
MLTALREHEIVRKAMLIQSDEHATLELSGKLTHYQNTLRGDTPRRGVI